VERSAPAPPSPPAVEEPVVFSDPPIPVARIRAGQAPAAATVEPAISTSTGDATAVATPASPVQDPPVQDPPADERAPPTTNLAFRDPVKTIHSGNTTIEIRRLTPEEKRSRQARRNLLMLLVGAALLVALVVVLGASR
jgi:hypothetical protein